MIGTGSTFSGTERKSEWWSTSVRYLIAKYYNKHSFLKSSIDLVFEWCTNYLFAVCQRERTRRRYRHGVWRQDLSEEWESSSLQRVPQRQHSTADRRNGSRSFRARTLQVDLHTSRKTIRWMHQVHIEISTRVNQYCIFFLNSLNWPANGQTMAIHLKSLEAMKS